MNIKTYRGSEMAAVLAQIKDELGDEVEILSAEQQGSGKVEVRVALGSLRGAVEVSRSLPSDMIETFTPRSHRVTQQLEDVLYRQGVHPEYVSRILSEATSATTIDKIAGESLQKLLTFDTSLPGGKRVVALVGATGVGKTTTVAKLAANMKIAFDMSVALVSADTYRVGAGQQLESYAELLDIPYAVTDDSVPLAEGIYKAVKQIGKCDVVFVDTAGYNPRDNERIRSLSHALTQLQWCEKMLVLPAPSNDVDLRTAARAFSPLGCSRVVVSKTDESGYMGPILNTLLSLDKPVAFYTTGQRVPEDVEPASAARLGWMITRSFH